LNACHCDFCHQKVPEDVIGHVVTCGQVKIFCPACSHAAMVWEKRTADAYTHLHYLKGGWK
jgi:hypothetical protein